VTASCTLPPRNCTFTWVTSQPVDARVMSSISLASGRSQWPVLSHAHSTVTSQSSNSSICGKPVWSTSHTHPCGACSWQRSSGKPTRIELGIALSEGERRVHAATAKRFRCFDYAPLKSPRTCCTSCRRESRDIPLDLRLRRAPKSRRVTPHGSLRGMHLQAARSHMGQSRAK
jgi:hypothetical protein